MSKIVSKILTLGWPNLPSLTSALFPPLRIDSFTLYVIETRGDSWPKRGDAPVEAVSGCVNTLLLGEAIEAV